MEHARSAPSAEPPEGAARSRTQARGRELREALLAASSWLDQQAARVDSLNVFPVPDGDTGTNMSLTLRAAAAAVLDLPQDAPLGTVARCAYEAAMLDARGNSGVILSQLIRGFAEAASDRDVLTPAGLAAALARAAEVAYQAVSRPVEGTILTVARRVAEAAGRAAGSHADLCAVLAAAVREAEAAVADTPSQLEVLRKAGVVDAGGEGYHVVLEGIWLWATGRAAPSSVPGQGLSAQALDELHDNGEVPFGFCTELLVRHCTLPLEQVRATIEQLGQSVLVVGDTALLRVHVHTLRPGQVLDFAVDHGTLDKIKVENMELQHGAFASRQQPSTPPDQSEPLAAGLGMVAVAAGDGFRDVLASLGALIVDGGQTMNPSVQDLLDAIGRTRRTEVVVLPNNHNALPAAQRAAEQADVRVRVIPTETVPQGISALLAFNFDADLDTNARAMENAASSVRTIEMTHAVRDAEVDGLIITQGQLMGILDGQVVSIGETAEDVLLRTLDALPELRWEAITLYYGSGAGPRDAEALGQALAQRQPNAAIEIVPGGQPHYPYVVSLE